MAISLSLGNSILRHHHRNRRTTLLHSPTVVCFTKLPSSNLSLASGSRLFSNGGKLSLNNRSDFRLRSFQREDAEYSDAASYIDNSERRDEATDGILGSQENKTTSTSSSWMVKLQLLLYLVALILAGIIAAVALVRSYQGSFTGTQILDGGASSSTSSVLPGWIYFPVLMHPGCGHIHEATLNIWVGIFLSRMLSLDGTRQSFFESLSKNAPHILSTVLWLYWGVCIGDMVPFYGGKLFKKSGASDDVYSKVGISKEKALGLTQIVQKYGNLIGFVARFSPGMRKPTAFLAGALGISPMCFFAGVCCGGLITLPIQLGIGFLLRKIPVFALVTVVTVVEMWILIPAAVAMSKALFFNL